MLKKSDLLAASAVSHNAAPFYTALVGYELRVSRGGVGIALGRILANTEDTLTVRWLDERGAEVTVGDDYRVKWPTKAAGPLVGKVLFSETDEDPNSLDSYILTTVQMCLGDLDAEHVLVFTCLFIDMGPAQRARLMKAGLHTMSGFKTFYYGNRTTAAKWIQAIAGNPTLPAVDAWFQAANGSYYARAEAKLETARSFFWTGGQAGDLNLVGSRKEVISLDANRSLVVSPDYEDAAGANKVHFEDQRLKADRR